MSGVQTVGQWLTTAPWRDRAVSLLLVEDGEVTQASTLADKRALLTCPYGALIVLWTGKWWTEARTVTTDEKAAIAALLA